MFVSAQDACPQQVLDCHRELGCRESLSVRVPVGCIEISGLACPICLQSEHSQGVAMDADDRLRELMRLSFSEIRALPESSAQDLVDEEGKKCQLVTWREQIGPESCRVVVSQHRMRGLGGSSLCSARGFTIHSSGAIEMLNPAEAERLFL